MTTIEIFVNDVANQLEKLKGALDSGCGATALLAAKHMHTSAANAEFELDRLHEASHGKDGNE